MSAQKRAMRVRGVRFSDTSWKAIEAVSRQEGVSASQFVREAALMRTVALIALRDPKRAKDFWDHFALIARHLPEETAVLVQRAVADMRDDPPAMPN